MAGSGAKSAAAIGVTLALFAVGQGHHHGRGGGTAASLTAAPLGGSMSANVALGQKMAAKRGWTGSQWTCLYQLWQSESSWSATADTRQTGAGGDGPGSPVFAYGIPQFRGHGPVINGITAPYPAQAANPPDLGGQSDPATQIRLGLGYIAANYGTPCGALSYKYGPGQGLGY